METWLNEAQEQTELRVNLLGIVAWYYDDDDPKDPTDQWRTIGLDAVDKVLEDRLATLSEHELYVLADALGSYPYRSQAVDSIYQAVDKAHGQTLDAIKALDKKIEELKRC